MIAKFVCIFIASVYSCFALAQEASAPNPAKNVAVKMCKSSYYSRDRLEKCQTIEFLERRGGDLVFLVQEDGEQVKKEQVLTSDLSTKVRAYPASTYRPHSFFLQFPMKKGSSWKGEFEQENAGAKIQKRTRSAEVVDYGEIKLPAGTFKAYEIRAFNHWSEARNPATEKYFYCPELAMICSYESPDFDTYQVVVEVRKTN